MIQKHYIGYPGVSKLKSPCQNTPGNKFLASGDPFWPILDEIRWFFKIFLQNVKKNPSSWSDSLENLYLGALGAIGMCRGGHVI